MNSLEVSNVLPVTKQIMNLHTSFSLTPKRRGEPKRLFLILGRLPYVAKVVDVSKTYWKE